MTIRTKAIAGLLFASLLALSSGMLALYVQEQALSLLEAAARTTRVQQLHAQLRSLLHNASSDQLLHVLTGAADLPARIAAHEQGIRSAFDQLEATIRVESQQVRLRETRAVYESWQRAALPRLRAAHLDDPGSVILESELLFQPLRRSLEEFHERQVQISTTAQQRLARFRLTARTILIGFLVAVLAIVAALIVGVNRRVLVPLQQLTDAAASVSHGHISRIDPVERSDEIGLLTNSLSRMTRTILEREDELRIRHRELETTLETLPAAFILVDRQGRLRIQNRAATALIGPPPKDETAMAHYRGGFKLRSRDGQELPADQWPLARALRGEVVKGEDVEVTGRGVTVPMLIAAAPVRSLSGEVDGAVVAFQDVSALRALDRLKDEFVSVVSHELRTPLTSIRGSLQLVLDDPDAVQDEDHRQLLNVALNNCERLIRIINDILDISKIEAGQMTLHMSPVRVGDVVRSALETVEPVARKADVRFAVDLPPELPVVIADSDRLVQALVNLLSNAVKFAPSDSEVRVTVAHRNGRIAIAVEDQGSGIAEEDLARLFQKFQQVDASASRRKGGTGLGLAISKALVEQHGGRINVESALGRGTCFTIVLPAGPGAPQSTAPVQTNAVIRVRPGAGTVLVIDDDDEFRLVIRRHLEKGGYDVVEARDGAAGLHVAREARPDLITLDLMMPGMNGWDLLARLSEDPELRSIPVVIISAVADQAGPLAREVAVLAKPITQDQLLREIADALERPGATVLLAEPDEMLRRRLASALAAEGYRVLQATDGAEALAELDRTAVDLLVVNVRMPNVDGLTVVRRVREAAGEPGVPVIVVAEANAEADARFRAMRLGANAFVAKPVDAGELASRIEHLLARQAPPDASD